MRGRRNQHQWGHMGIDIETGFDYAYCDLCKKYNYSSDNGFTFIPKSFYENRVKLKKVTIDGKIISL